MSLVGAWLCVDTKNAQVAILFRKSAEEIEEELVNAFMGKEK